MKHFVFRQTYFYVEYKCDLPVVLNENLNCLKRCILSVKRRFGESKIAEDNL